MFHFQQRSGAVLFRSRNCLESSIPGVNRSPIRYTFCDAPFHYPVQCEATMTSHIQHEFSDEFHEFTDVIQIVFSAMITFSKGGAAKIKSISRFQSLAPRLHCTTNNRMPKVFLTHTFTQGGV